VTLEQAIATTRKIQDDLDSGRLTVPYPPEVRRTILRCCGVFMDYATDSEKATALVARLSAPVTVELPW
jgi:hypothetical protein